MPTRDDSVTACLERAREVDGLAIVVPVYDEADNIPALLREIRSALEQIDRPTEIILVDDGSRDATAERIREAMQLNRGLSSVRLGRNQGQSAAILAGVRAARMSLVATMDGDLQNDPADLVAMVSQTGDCDVVIGRRARRRDRLTRRVAARVANRFRRMVLRDGASDTGCSLKLFPRSAYLALPAFDGMHRFLPALFRYQGLSIREVAVSHRARQRGRSKYTNLGRLRRTLFDLLGVLWLSHRTIGLHATMDAARAFGTDAGPTRRREVVEPGRVATPGAWISQRRLPRSIRALATGELFHSSHRR